jgi:hypothetical protein
MDKELIIGEILEDGTIEKDVYDGADIYKSYPDFYNKTDKVCYVPEQDDDEYTYSDFLEMMNGNEELATHLFNVVSWQHPETLREEWLDEGYIEECSNCGKYFEVNEGVTPECPFCN